MCPPRYGDLPIERHRRSHHHGDPEGTERGARHRGLEVVSVLGSRFVSWRTELT
jgi:hypothetical protein